MGERECKCPEWVKRCAHFDGRWVVLHNAFDAPALVVCEGQGLVDTGKDYWHEDATGIMYYGDDDAQEAFIEAEERLLRGE